MPPQQNHAQPDTLLGLLQRGRGEGYRQLLAISRRDAREPLLDCICNDPRLDRQVESRAGYYAGLAIETDLDLNPVIRYVREYDDKDQGWNTTLAIQTLGELAKRDYKESVGMLCDYVQWGQWWDWILEDLIAGKDSSLQASVASIIEERFPGGHRVGRSLVCGGLE